MFLSYKFCWFTFFFLNQYHTILITVVLHRVLKLVSLFFFLAVLLCSLSYSHHLVCLFYFLSCHFPYPVAIMVSNTRTPFFSSPSFPLSSFFSFFPPGHFNHILRSGNQRTLSYVDVGLYISHIICELPM